MKTQETIKSVGTWLPAFTGFYGTIFEYFTDYDNCESEIQYINEQRAENNLPALSKDIELDIDYAGAQKELSKQIFNIVTGELEKEGFVHKSTFEKLSSPREYNFYNDSIWVNFEFLPENVDKVWNYIKDHYKEWTQFLKDKYTPCDGFIPYYENYPNGNDWIHIGACLDDKHKAGLILDFILSNEGFDSESIYYKIEFNISEYITSFDELLTLQEVTQ